MRALERRFNNITRLNPYWSSYVCFAEAIKNQEFSKRTIMFHFNGCVKKDDYRKEEKKSIIKHLISLSEKDKSRAEDSMFWGHFADKTLKLAKDG